MTIRLSLVAATLLTTAFTSAVGAENAPIKSVVIDQGVDQATLQRYNHTDQGTRLIPAAWLATLDTPDGSRKFMNADDLRRLGFILDDVKDESNPFGWPVGLTVSDPKTSGGVSIAGVTCAACHTGQLEYKGTAIRINGGQAMLDSNGFFGGMFAALLATDKDASRRAKFFADAINAGYPAAKMEADFRAYVAEIRSISPAPGPTTPSSFGRSDAVQGIANRVFGTDLKVPANLKVRNAPVSFPYVWDIWRLSWLQYNGFQPGEFSQARNIGEVLGVFAKLNLVDPKSGALNPEPLRWQSSVQLHNLLWMEKTLRGLRAPTFPTDVFGPIDQAKAERGKELFKTHCVGCHGIKELPNGTWDVTITPLQHIRTDPKQTTNWAAGSYDGSKLGLRKTTAYRALPAAINGIRKQLYVDNKTPASEQEGDVVMEAPCGYKARPLIGVWATPPFLHNGSVRTVFDLLSEQRPAKFNLGSREYDPVNFGYTDNKTPNSAVFDTSVAGNANTGHWFTNDGNRPGWIGPRLSDADKYALIEYLKAASYDNYPSEKRAEMIIMPCQGKIDWAQKN
jgi:mono/diheme cytochrome c family protein